MLARNIQRTMDYNSNSLAKNMEKLSSRYRINCASDDAAGLTISEEMRKMIRGLEQESKNFENGISMV